MKFTKMQGIGNDYVYVNCFTETVENPSETARLVSDRHFGIGSDGLILIKPSDKADFEMEMYNLDGSRGAMCGNGIRCVAKYVYDYGLTDKTTITVDTLSGIKTLDLTVENGKVSLVRVNMGSPVFDCVQIPVALPQQQAVDQPVTVGGKEYRFTAVSMGNPHAVVFVPEVKDLDLPVIGPGFEHHPLFPDRVNTEFIKVSGRNELTMRVWERGSGETLACGTGACAAAAAAIVKGLADEKEPVTVHLLGGDLSIFWDRNCDRLFMTGPAEVVFDGEIQLKS